jgi:hypothetical protein|tara:strand:- start:656 stop:799 length:144 start_codon:yes stop_codon:yes gene_type:complete
VLDAVEELLAGLLGAAGELLVQCGLARLRVVVASPLPSRNAGGGGAV